MVSVEDIKVIFLDVDGVLNSQEYWDRVGNAFRERFNQIDVDKIVLLNQIIEATQAKIVISSCWRLLHYEELLDILSKKGLVGEIIGMTPSLSLVRGLEIQKWLDGNPNVTRFVILDDSDDMEHLDGHLIQPNFYSNGLKLKHVEAAIVHLNRRV